MARAAKKAKRKQAKRTSVRVTRSPKRSPRRPLLRAAAKSVRQHLSQKVSSTKTVLKVLPLTIRHPVRALIFELETLAVEQGRKKIFDSAKQALSSAGIALAPVLYSKSGIEVTPSSFISTAFSVLRVRTPSQPRLRIAFDESYRKALCEKSMLRPGLADIIDKARAHGLKTAAISLLDSSVAGDVMRATGLADLGVDLVCGRAWIVHPYHENLVNQVLNRLELHPGTCLSLVSSGAAAEAALCAGTKVLAVPDSFTSFQGFSGVDEVLDTWSPQVVQSVLSLNGEGHG